MNILQMEMRCAAVEKVCTGVLKDYQLAFRHGGVATVIPVVGSEVPVVLWNITNCESRLDVYEGYPRVYIKGNLQIETGNGIVTAMAYIMAENYSKLISRPSKEYSNIIKDGYTQNGIDLNPLEAALKQEVEVVR